MVGAQDQETNMGAKARIGLNEAPVNGKAKMLSETVANPIAMGAVTFLEMTDRLRQVLHRMTHVRKKVPKVSKTNAEEAVEP